jgi:hypothetical protein
VPHPLIPNTGNTIVQLFTFQNSVVITFGRPLCPLGSDACGLIADSAGNTRAANSAAVIAEDEARRIPRLSMDSTPDAKSLAFCNNPGQRPPFGYL